MGFGNKILKLLLVSFCAVTVSASTCTYYSSSGYYHSISCPGLFDDSDESYCCGSSTYKYCCDYDTYSPTTTTANVGAIVGGVIVSLLIVGGIIACIICCCVASCPMYQRRNRGRVITGTGAVVVSNTQTVQTVSHPQTYPMGSQPPPPGTYGNQQPQPPPNYGAQQPPSYGNQPAPPPQYGNTGMYPPPPSYVPPTQDPAYPPKQ